MAVVDVRIRSQAFDVQKLRNMRFISVIDVHPADIVQQKSYPTAGVLRLPALRFVLDNFDRDPGDEVLSAFYPLFTRFFEVFNQQGSIVEDFVIPEIFRQGLQLRS